MRNTRFLSCSYGVDLSLRQNIVFVGKHVLGANQLLQDLRLAQFPSFNYKAMNRYESLMYLSIADS